ncbi:hypothetical protein P154DRAFT_621147 [Amniculicola lignicola CBS 123094]|uniref:Ecp2 effector protein domain-containing protein n=1 Tax=Amniculicola lignicola CBS 123094 TaxID=1392246 RepID=A0A6A5WD96_9PLEO|nr:hypothetical protein P154DRAFT_621147 [Amniculicola lignicola CBS 123094]
MRYSILTTLFAVAVLGAPLASVNEIPNLRLYSRDVADQGDGLYIATTDASNKTAVEFTPLEELLKTEKRNIDARSPAPLNSLQARSLVPRETQCVNGYSSNLADLTQANKILIDNAGEGWREKGTWGWVHWGGETSFWCNYERNYLTRRTVYDMHVVITTRCQEHGYGLIVEMIFVMGKSIDR